MAVGCTAEVARDARAAVLAVDCRPKLASWLSRKMGWILWELTIEKLCVVQVS